MRINFVMEKAYQKVLLDNNETLSYKDLGSMIKDLSSRRPRMVVLTEDQIKLGTTAKVNTKNGMATFVSASGVETNIDLAKIFVGRKIEPSEPKMLIFGGGAQTSSDSRKGQGDPQPKTYGKGKRNGRKQGGGSADTQTAQDSGSGKSWKRKGRRQELSQAEYENLLIKEIIRLNRPSDIKYGGIKSLRVPRSTPDGTQWEMVDRFRTAWTFKSKDNPEMVIDLSIVEVQLHEDFPYKEV